MDVLIAEDDAALRSVLERSLAKHGFRVRAVARGDDALQALTEAQYAVAVVDWRMPGLEGTEVIAQARDAGCSTPILMLTARDRHSDRVAGLDAGADDYLVKPFELDELLARIRALLRRPRAALPPIILRGDLGLDPRARTATLAGVPLGLTPIEFGLAEILAVRSPSIVSRATLTEGLWPEGEATSWNALEAHVARLRAKLQGSNVTIATVRGRGYRLTTE